MIGALDGGFRGDPWPGTDDVHADKRCRIAKVDDSNGKTNAQGESYQLPQRASDCSLRWGIPSTKLR